ncbi:Holo-[acyl-carrier-protein] synthase [Buchnera aphidicola (Neophyllaphis podocarpi)]|uniref:holo-ACP synthase n=1 Tax=Buchnera aphidicola TaxID=9 RepID=UPI0031B83693
MSIVGIGTDIIEIKRIKNSISKLKDKLAKKILSKYELKKYLISKDYIKFLAKRFVAKEALVKALGTGFRNGLYFNNLEIYNDYLGKPNIRFINKGVFFTKNIGIKKIHLSISDEVKYAHAIVIIEN